MLGINFSLGAQDTSVSHYHEVVICVTINDETIQI
jgi:hypothetical protein